MDNQQKLATRRRKTKQTHNTICVGHYAQANTNHVNKTGAVLRLNYTDFPGFEDTFKQNTDFIRLIHFVYKVGFNQDNYFITSLVLMTSRNYKSPCSMTRVCKTPTTNCR
jgi:hypothetical protein